MAIYDKILVAVDFSPAAGAVLSRARDIASVMTGTGGGEGLILLHIVEYLPPISFAEEPFVANDWLVDDEELKSSASQSLLALAQRHDLAQVRQIVQVGIPRQSILQTAAEEQVSLIIIGSHGRHGIARLLGSTASAIVQQAACDVLAVRIGQ